MRESPAISPKLRDDTQQASAQLARLRWVVHMYGLYAVVMLVYALALRLFRPANMGADIATCMILAGLLAAVLLGWTVVELVLKSHPQPGPTPWHVSLATVGILAFGSIVLPLVNLSPNTQLLAILVVLHAAISASVMIIGLAYLLACISGVVFLLASQPWAPDSAPLATSTAEAVILTVVLIAAVYFVSAILWRLRRINSRLIDTNRQLAGLDLAKSRFLRVSSHQLRGPLAAIHSLLSAMEQAGPLSEGQQELSRRIQSRAGEAMAEIDEMMLLSTIKEHAGETRELEDVDLRQALSQCVDNFEAEAKQKGVRLELDGASMAALREPQGGRHATFVVRAWEDAVETVFEHLLSNAIKYTPSGGSVTVRCSAVEGKASIEVRDTGIGIPADQQASLFKEFFRATNARQLAGGTGLGLSIVKAIVERLGGQISVQSGAGEGTTVRVVLPATSVPAAVNVQ